MHGHCTADMTRQNMDTIEMSQAQANGNGNVTVSASRVHLQAKPTQWIQRLTQLSLLQMVKTRSGKEVNPPTSKHEVRPQHMPETEGTTARDTAAVLSAATVSAEMQA